MDLTVRRLEMSIFEGWNPEGWIYRAERYFCLNNLSAPEKMEAAAISLDGEALAWFQWEDHRRPFRSWEESKLRLLVRFSQNQEGSLCEKFLSLKQESTVREYRRVFVSLASPWPNLPEHVMESAFINGLRPDIRAEVRMLKPGGAIEQKRVKLTKKLESLITLS